jgi:hypothetical protein
VERSMNANNASISRRTAIGGAFVGLATLALSGRAVAQGKPAPTDSFVLLLKGLYQPVVHAPNLGLHTVNLNDGSYTKTKIYPVHGTPGYKQEHSMLTSRGGTQQRQNKAVGDFYAQGSKGDLCAYHLPGGSFAMQFTPEGTDVNSVPDGHGGKFLEGTFDLTILEATGIYRPFVGGHNHMVDKAHFLAPGDGSGGLDEYCFCNISRP